MVGSWGDIPPPPGKASELKIGVLTDISEIEEKIGQTLFQLPEELRHQFINGVRGLLLNGCVRCIRSNELISERTSVVGSAAANTLKDFVFRIHLDGLDELCAAALRAAHSNGA